MRFLDFSNSTFKAANGGRRVFLPWGPLGRGYIVPSEAEFHRLRKKVKIFLVISFIGLLAALPVVSSQADFRGFILVIYYFVPYQIWVYSQCRHLERADEGLTFHERIAKQSRTVPINFLWVSEITALGFVVAGIIIITIDWRAWYYSLAAIGAIVFFGYRAIIAAKMLLAKKPPGNGKT
jgi:hypothetical protein